MRPLFVSCVVVLSACGPQMMTPDAGNANFTCDPNATPVTLAGKVQADIFDKQCKSCHNAFDASNGDFSEASKTAAAITATSKTAGFKRVEPNNLGRSTLWLKMLNVPGPNGENAGGVMPPGGALPADQQKLVKDWICTGAK
jgi:hypothetical protein